MSLQKRAKEILLSPKAKKGLHPDWVSSAPRLVLAPLIISYLGKSELARSKPCQELVYWLNSTDG